MSTLEHIAKKYNLDLSQKSPIAIPNMIRADLAELFHELAFRSGVEIGVAAGVFSETLMNGNPRLRMWGVDPYEPHTGYRDYVHRSTFEELEGGAKARLGENPQYTFVKKYSLDAAKDFEDSTLDFVYIDGNHCFEAVVADIAAWLPKIRSGGIICGDDYFKHKGNARIQVVPAVNGYTDAWQIKPWFLIGANEKVPHQRRDNGRSWLWVKQ